MSNAARISVFVDARELEEVESVNLFLSPGVPFLERTGGSHSDALGLAGGPYRLSLLNWRRRR
ncbi:MAG TPA: hypothetical protein VMO26_03385 [Vicinamibacterales bacterium]|nr:hypothetical protein [Vicinamibacterales bacterium]